MIQRWSPWPDRLRHSWYHDTIPFYEYDDIVHKDSRVWWPLWARSPKAGYASAGQPTNTKYSNNKREREKIRNNHRDRQDVFSDLQTNTKKRDFVKTKERQRGVTNVHKLYTRQSLFVQGIFIHCIVFMACCFALCWNIHNVYYPLLLLSLVTHVPGGGPRPKNENWEQYWGRTKNNTKK